VKAADESGEHGTAPDGDSWEEWLQTHRVELNAMTTPQFIEWLDRKMAAHGVGKLVPPASVLTAELEQRIEQKVRATLTERILREAGLDRQLLTRLRSSRPRAPPSWPKASDTASSSGPTVNGAITSRPRPESALRKSEARRRLAWHWRELLCENEFEPCLASFSRAVSPTLGWRVIRIKQ